MSDRAERRITLSVDAPAPREAPKADRLAEVFAAAKEQAATLLRSGGAVALDLDAPNGILLAPTVDLASAWAFRDGEPVAVRISPRSLRAEAWRTNVATAAKTAVWESAASGGGWTLAGEGEGGSVLALAAGDSDPDLALARRAAGEAEADLRRRAEALGRDGSALCFEDAEWMRLLEIERDLAAVLARTLKATAERLLAGGAS